MNISIVVLAFLLTTSTIAQNNGDDDEIYAFVDDEALYDDPISKVGEIKESLYTWGKRDNNDRIVANQSDVFNYLSLQDISLKFKYPDSTNQRDKITYVIIHFNTDSPEEFIYSNFSGQPGHGIFEISIKVLKLKYMKYDFKLYAN